MNKKSLSILWEKRKKEPQEERQKRAITDKAVVWILSAIVVCCVFFLLYHNQHIRKQEMEYEKLRTKETEEVSEEAVMEETEEALIYCSPVYDFAKLREENKDIYAWIVVPGTQVDYPVLQAETDNYYLEYNLDHSKGYPGCIYTNSCNSKDFTDYNTILYGHNMRNGSMFGSIRNFEEKAFFDEHPFIYVYTETERLTYEICEAAKFTDVYIPAQYEVNSREDRDRFYRDVKETVSDNNLCVRENSEIGEADRLITLSTCVGGNDNLRYLVIGVLMETAYYR